MDVAMTARKGQISRALRTQAEEGMERIGRVLGRTARASITFSAQRHVHIVELTVQARTQKIAATGKADTPRCSASRGDGARRASGPPLPRPAHGEQSSAQGRKNAHRAAGCAAQGARRSRWPSPRKRNHPRWQRQARASIAVHSFPSRATVVEPHILKNGEAIALKPMTIEEAVKDAEFRDRDLLIFRTASGDTFVLHRRRDGQMELVEIP